MHSSTKLNNFVVIGNPITHSKSPDIHNFWYENLKISANYNKLELPNLDNLKQFFLQNNISGANITLPFKEEAYLIADVLSDDVKEIKAANTVVFKNNKLYAYNTDVYGFITPLNILAKENGINIKSALIIGAGGASRACYYALKTAGVDTYVLNRSTKDDFLCEVKTSLNRFDFDVIINSTSSSLKDLLPIDERTLVKLFSSSKIAYDLVYKESVFLKLAKENNQICLDGLKMLVYQAALACEYFCGIRPSEELIRRTIERLKENY